MQHASCCCLLPRSPRHSGNGLGLFLVKQACREMGMEVVASSPGLGQGSSFVISGLGEMKL